MGRRVRQAVVQPTNSIPGVAEAASVNLQMGGQEASAKNIVEETSLVWSQAYHGPAVAGPEKGGRIDGKAVQKDRDDQAEEGTISEVFQGETGKGSQVRVVGKKEGDRQSSTRGGGFRMAYQKHVGGPE